MPMGPSVGGPATIFAVLILIGPILFGLLENIIFLVGFNHTYAGFIKSRIGYFFANLVGAVMAYYVALVFINVLIITFSSCFGYVPGVHDFPFCVIQSGFTRL